MHLLEWLGIAAGSVLMIGALARGGWRFLRLVVFIGEAVKELLPNGGSSMKDTVTRTEQKVDDTALRVDDTASKVDENTRKLGELERRLDEHLTGEA